MGIEKLWRETIREFNQTLDSWPLEQDRTPTIISGVKNIETLLQDLVPIGDYIVVDMGYANFDSISSIKKQGTYLEIYWKDGYDEHENNRKSLLRLKPLQMFVLPYLAFDGSNKRFSYDRGCIILNGKNAQICEFVNNKRVYNQKEGDIVLLYPKGSVYSRDYKMRDELIKRFENARVKNR